VAKYRAQLLEPEKKKAAGEGFDVMKSGGEWGYRGGVELGERAEIRGHCGER
jgi:hypothetical protein